MIMSQSLLTCMIPEARLGRGEENGRLWSSIRSRSNAIGFELGPEESATDVRPTLGPFLSTPFSPAVDVAHLKISLPPAEGLNNK